jgi:hypothetical protein
MHLDARIAFQNVCEGAIFSIKYAKGILLSNGLDFGGIKQRILAGLVDKVRDACQPESSQFKNLRSVLIAHDKITPGLSS